VRGPDRAGQEKMFQVYVIFGGGAGGGARGIDSGPGAQGRTPPVFRLASPRVQGWQFGCRGTFFRALTGGRSGSGEQTCQASGCGLRAALQARVYIKRGRGGVARGGGGGGVGRVWDGGGKGRGGGGFADSVGHRRAGTVSSKTNATRRPQNREGRVPENTMQPIAQKPYERKTR